MKKVMIMIALVVSAVSLTKAQGGGGGGQQGPPEQRAQALLDNQRLASLSLTPEQKTKMLPILIKTYKSTDSLRAAANGDFASVAPKMTPINEAGEKLLVALLTPAQKPAYDALLAARKERQATATTAILGGGGRGGGGGGQGGTPPPPPAPPK